MIEALQVLRGLLSFENWDACSALLEESLFADDVQRGALRAINRYHQELGDGDDMRLEDLATMLPSAPTSRILIEALSKLPERKKKMETEVVRQYAREASARRLGQLAVSHAEAKPDKRSKVIDEIFEVAAQVTEVDERLSSVHNDDIVTLSTGGLDEILTPSQRIPIPFFPTLGHHLGGGLPVGSLGLVMAPTKGGKSLMLANMGAAAIKEGYDVLHFTMELGEELVRLWYLAILSGIPLEELPHRRGELSKLKVKGNLFICDYSHTTPTIGQIVARVKALKRKKEYSKIRLILVDYLDGDLILSRGKDAKTHEVMGTTAARLRAMGRAEDAAVVTAQQINRQGAMGAEYRWKHAADSIKPPRIADYVIVHQEPQAGWMDVLLDLNRYGPGEQRLRIHRWDSRMRIQEQQVVPYWGSTDA